MIVSGMVSWRTWEEGDAILMKEKFKEAAIQGRHFYFSRTSHATKAGDFSFI